MGLRIERLNDLEGRGYRHIESSISKLEKLFRDVIVILGDKQFLVHAFNSFSVQHNNSQIELMLQWQNISFASR